MSCGHKKHSCSVMNIITSEWCYDYNDHIVHLLCEYTLHLNYYHMQSQYKCVIQFVQQYKNLYAKFEAYLRRNEGLIRNSVLFKSWKFRIV